MLPPSRLAPVRREARVRGRRRRDTANGSAATGFFPRDPPCFPPCVAAPIVPAGASPAHCRSPAGLTDPACRAPASVFARCRDDSAVDVRRSAPWRSPRFPSGSWRAMPGSWPRSRRPAGGSPGTSWRRGARSAGRPRRRDTSCGRWCGGISRRPAPPGRSRRRARRPPIPCWPPWNRWSTPSRRASSGRSASPYGARRRRGGSSSTTCSTAAATWADSPSVPPGSGCGSRGRTPSRWRRAPRRTTSRTPCPGAWRRRCSRVSAGGRSCSRRRTGAWSA